MPSSHIRLIERIEFDDSDVDMHDPPVGAGLLGFTPERLHNEADAPEVDQFSSVQFTPTREEVHSADFLDGSTATLSPFSTTYSLRLTPENGRRFRRHAAAVNLILQSPEGRMHVDPEMGGAIGSDRRGGRAGRRGSGNSGVGGRGRNHGGGGRGGGNRDSDGVKAAGSGTKG